MMACDGAGEHLAEFGEGVEDLRPLRSMRSVVSLAMKFSLKSRLRLSYVMQNAKGMRRVFATEEPGSRSCRFCHVE